MTLPRLAGALLAAMLLFSACTKSNAPTTVNGHNTWTVPGTIRVGNSDEPDSLNALYAHNDASAQVQGLIYASLLRYDDNGNYIPDLATAVPSYANGGISRDNLTVTFHLRHNAKWSDGAPLTARDWMFTYHAVLNPANTVKTTYGWDDIASANAPDDYTIVVHLKKPLASILGIFVFDGSAYPPLPVHLLGKLHDLNRADFNAHPISSGPYVLTQWTHGAEMVFEPNPYYFRGKPAVKIDWKIVPDYNTLFTMLQTHAIDMEIGVNENDVSRLSQISGYTISNKLIANWRHMGINMSRPFLRDQRVRLAIAEGVDWPRINNTMYHGYNRLAVSDIYPASWAAPNIPRYTYDPNDSKRLLAQAGWTMGSDGYLHDKSGQRLQLTISTGTNKQENIESEVQIQSDLKPLGIDIQIHNYPVSLLFDRSGPLYTGRYDLEWSVDTNAPDPDNACQWVTSCIPPHGSNTSWLSDPVVDRTAGAAQLTFDTAKRKALYQQEEARIHQLVPVVFFYWEVEYNAINSDVQNVKPAAFVQDTWNSWQWKVAR